LEAINRATSLVGQILAFTRQEDTKRVPLHLATTIQESIKLLRPLLPSTITIHQQINEDTLPILANATQVHQIVMNLCTNAFHVMELTGGTLTIVLKNTVVSQSEIQHLPDVSPGNYVQLTIGDTGPGIPPEIRDKIFDPYFTTKNVGKGTGMGLAIVNGIVKNYGGFIVIDSQEGKGTFFQIYIPAVERAECIEQIETRAIAKGNERILLVDDEEIVAEMGRSVLEYLGYTVTVCTNSIEALRVFQNAELPFDVILTDQTMPGMTGLDLAQRILALRPDIPIIICTGYSSTLSEEKALAVGVRGFAMKPLAIHDISQLIRKVIDE